MFIVLGEKPPAMPDIFQHLGVDGRVVPLNSVDAVRRQFLPAARSFA